MASRLLAALFCLSLLAQTTAQPDTRLLDRARGLIKSSPLIDGHNDYPWEVRERAQQDLEKLDIRKPQPSIMTDIPRLRSGGVGGQFWSVYVPVELEGQSAVTATLEQIDIVYRMVRKYPTSSSWRSRPTTSSGRSRRDAFPR